MMLPKTGIFALCLMCFAGAVQAENWLCTSVDAVAAEREFFRGRSTEFIDVKPENYVVTINRETDNISVKVIGGSVRFSGPDCRMESNYQDEPMAVCSSIKGYFFMATDPDATEGIFISTRVVVEEDEPSFQAGMCEPF